MTHVAKGKPREQPFCVSPHPNRTKRNSWWNPLSDSYWVKKKKALKGDKVTKVPGLPVAGPESE